MATKGTTTKGIMLPDSLWDAIDQDAAISEDSRSAWMRKRITHYFSQRSSVGISGKNAPSSDILEFE